LALHEAEHFLGQAVPTVHVLSIGTTTAQFSFAHALGRGLGAFQWLEDQRLVNVMIASQQYSVDFMMRHRLGARYLRVDALQSKEQERHLALDVATAHAQRTIRGLAAATAQDVAAQPALLSFFENVAPEPVFFHEIGDA
jgi:hypothetical protein